MKFYQRLRELKEDACLSQKQVAELIGVSMSQYGKYERGEIDIPFEKAIILAKYYGVSLDYLSGLTNQKNRNQNESEFVCIQESDAHNLIVCVENMFINYDVQELKK